MDEKYIVLLLSIAIIGIATSFAYFVSTGTILGIVNFNFYSSTLSVNGTKVTETLLFAPDQPYHTLYRNFVSTIASSGPDTISISNVNCSSGTPYYRTFSGTCYTFQAGQANNMCLANTQNNEYGCTFGDVRGFSTGNAYSMTATYTVNPANLFLINGKYYIKFVAYSANRHVDLRLGSNFFVKGGITGNEFTPNQSVFVYIPYNGSTLGFNVIQQSAFGFSNGSADYGILFYNFFLFIIPLILFDALWIFFGKEKEEPTPPSKLSDIPNERKAWEVSAYFTPPFVSIGKNFYSALMLDFYRRKIIDIKYVDKGIFDKRTYVKINNGPFDLDDVEGEYLGLLKDVMDCVPEKNRDGAYFDISRANYWHNQAGLRIDALGLSALVKKEGKPFMDTTAYNIFAVLTVVGVFIGIFLQIFTLEISSFLFIFISMIINMRIPLLIRYNQDFYEEYEQWAAFKHGLSYLSSIKSARSDAIIQWEKYLVYATALGAADTVMKQLKSLGMINQTNLNNYNGAYVGSVGFGGSFGGSGGGGGAGGGGAGGGGGGGR